MAIAYNSGVVLCEQYEVAINGEKFDNIVRSGFQEAFTLSSDSVCKQFLMDGCPRQNSKKARRAIEEVGGIIFKIPSRSPDLNPIENVFNLTAKILNREAVEKNITHETFIEFSARVKRTLETFPVDTINRTIDSMPRRVNMVLESNGIRIKY